MKITARVAGALALAGAVTAMAGCGSGQAFPVETEVVPYTQEQIAARDSARSAEYRLRTGDRVSVAFKYEKDLDQDLLLILPDGNLSMAGLSNPVKASGLTIRELDRTLTEEFAEDYKDPELTVVINEITDPEVYVLGEVENPGLYKIPHGGGGVIQAIAVAGGFDEHAQKSQVVLMRATEEGFQISAFDLDHLEYRGIQDLAYLDLQPFDIVFVPRSTLGDFSYLTNAIFGSALNVSRFFWDIYAIGNLDKIDRIVR